MEITLIFLIQITKELNRKCSAQNINKNILAELVLFFFHHDQERAANKQLFKGVQ